MELDPNQRASQAQFDRQSDNYGKSHLLADTSDLDAAVEGIAFSGCGARALDVATGGGHTALWLARRGLGVTACDLSSKMLENAGRLLESEGFRLDGAVQCPAERLPFPDAAFEAVTCRVAAHHFTGPGAFVAEAARCLAPGGYLLVIDGTVPDGFPEAEAWLHQVETLRDPSHARLIRPSEWRAFCDRSGLEVLRCEVGRLFQPDLEAYFETAATPAENRAAVRQLVRSAPRQATECFQIDTASGKTTWWWPRLQMVARRNPGEP